ncbi:MAG: hypothetical protein ABR573_01495 [Candidatus Dormibacteria bacterium]
MAVEKPAGFGGLSSRWAARAILVLGSLFIVVGLSLVLLFGFSGPGLPATIWGLLLVVVYGFFEPEVVRGLLGRGQVQAGARALVQVLLVLGAVLLLNVVVRDKLGDKQLDLSKNHVNSLAPQTEQIVRRLDRRVNVTIWSQTSVAENQTAFDLLQRYRALNGNLTVHSYTTLDRPTLAQQQKILQAGSVVFETDGRPSQITTDMTEQGFDTALLRLSTGKAPKAYFLTGHGEPDIKAQSQTGASVTVLAAALAKQGITVAALNLASGGGGTGNLPPGAPALSPTPAPADTSGATPAPADTGASPPAADVTPAPSDSASPAPAAAPSASPSPSTVATAQVPADADEVIILDPRGNLNDAEIAAINGYMDRGGHILLAVSPFSKSNAGNLTKRFGVTFGGGIVLDQELQLRSAQPGILEIQKYGEGVVSRGLNTLPTILLGTTSVDGKPAAGYNATNVVTSGGDACERVDLSNTAGTCQSGDKKGPFNIMVSLEQTGAKAGTRPLRAILLAAPTLGSDALQLGQQVPPGNQPLMINAVNWLAGQDKIINIPPRATANSSVFLSEAQKSLVTLGYPVILPLLLLGLGVNAYLRRR